MKILKVIVLCYLHLIFCGQIFSQSNLLPFRNESLPLENRVNDLLERLTVEEKISLLSYNSPAIPRLGIPAYNWWNEALHGLARGGRATVFPQAIAMAASFDHDLLESIANSISTEARAKYNISRDSFESYQYRGLTFWSPNINIFRDPRWGRGQETYGEDPYLTSKMGMAFVKGLQGTDPYHLKTSATAKHFAVHSGPESLRHQFNAIADEKDLRETYLYAFRKLVDAGVESVMCAYNRINDQPCCTDNALLRSVLREEWGFKGQIVTDCWALEDIYARHKVAPDALVVAAEAVRAGINLDCSNLLKDNVLLALKTNKIDEKDINASIIHTLKTQFKLGLYDNPAHDHYKNFREDSIANDFHLALAKKMATESMVLLKNNGNLLPLDKNKIKSVIVLGPNSASYDVLIGNYHGITDDAVTYVEGIVKGAGRIKVDYDQGCDFNDTIHFGGLWSAGYFDIAIAVLGNTPQYEGEEGDAFLSVDNGDRKNLQLPASHIAFLKRLRQSIDKPIILILTGGGAIDISQVEQYADAIIFAWYSGEQGGNALSDIIFGVESPSGRLPVTFYKSVNDLPEFTDYNMKNRTYRYFEGPVLYPFGYGLSYTTFVYNWAEKPSNHLSMQDVLNFNVNIKNNGRMDGDEVVQVYIEYPNIERMPIKELKEFERISLMKNESKTMNFSIPVTELMKWDIQSNKWKLFQGKYRIFIGSNSIDKRLTAQVEISQ